MINSLVRLAFGRNFGERPSQQRMVTVTSTLAQTQAAVALDALDRITLSLAHRQHYWTMAERADYELAVQMLKSIE